jgi:hypothetical protein
MRRRVHVFFPPRAVGSTLPTLALRATSDGWGVAIIFPLGSASRLGLGAAAGAADIAADQAEFFVIWLVCPSSTRRRSLRLPRVQHDRDNEHQRFDFQICFRNKQFSRV